MNCDKCGKFMAKDGEEWSEFPLGPYTYQDWKCKCGNFKTEVVWDMSK